MTAAFLRRPRSLVFESTSVHLSHVPGDDTPAGYAILLRPMTSIRDISTRPMSSDTTHAAAEVPLQERAPLATVGLQPSSRASGKPRRCGSRQPLDRRHTASLGPAQPRGGVVTGWPWPRS